MARSSKSFGNGIMKKYSAFTLIELLVVVAIIALLISILLPALNDAKKQARESVCMSNMRQLAIGWVAYSSDYNGLLPGSARDVTGNSGDAKERWEGSGRTFDWLGTRGDWAFQIGAIREYVPRKGTIFKYVGEQAAVYKCPEDLTTKADVPGKGFKDKPTYSYTAPMILTGAPTSLLIRSRWISEFDAWNNLTDWNKTNKTSSPWMIVEEDDSCFLADIYDSAWCNNDEPSTRHRGKSVINHIDGSASIHKFQKVAPRPANNPDPRAFNSWKLYYDLADGRIVTAGTWDLGGGRYPQFGFLRTKDARRLNP